MNLKNLLSVAAIALILVTGCKKSTVDVVEEKPEVASASPLATFQSSAANYQLFVYRYDDVTATWTRRIGSHFSTIAEDGTSLGFTNPYVENSGVNLFGMVTLYTEILGTNNVKEAKINVPKLLQFYPSESGSKTGVVKIIGQDVVLTVAAGGSFKIGLSGEGTYDETTKVIDLTVNFNETAIGGNAKVVRKYKLSVAALTL